MSKFFCQFFEKFENLKKYLKTKSRLRKNGWIIGETEKRSRKRGKNYFQTYPQVKYIEVDLGAFID